MPWIVKYKEWDGDDHFGDLFTKSRELASALTPLLSTLRSAWESGTERAMSTRRDRRCNREHVHITRAQDGEVVRSCIDYHNDVAGLNSSTTDDLAEPKTRRKRAQKREGEHEGCPRNQTRSSCPPIDRFCI
jgi:hypothetical protein